MQSWAFSVEYRCYPTHPNVVSIKGNELQVSDGQISSFLLPQNYCNASMH
ncbi:hypothetical protein LguiA_001917 [Lonicera macranthoides]